MALPLLHLPDRISRTLAQDQELNGYIYSQLRRYAPWIKSSGTAFFPAYTDHGSDHLNRVLAACDWLVADESWPLVTPKDVGCLILSVLLHDSAMHLTQDSFRSLLSSKHNNVRYPTLDEGTWPELWHAYLLETKHWDSKKWAAVVGSDYANRLKVIQGQAYAIQLEDIKESELPIIGEFIRRYHPRMAHEFATGRVLDLAFDSPEPPELLDVSGLIARSHGLQIRNTFEYLDTFFFGNVEIYDSHPVFLMVLLRVADYLDLYAERAPNNLLAVKHIRSQFSSREWEAHQAIKELRYDSHSDPERLDVIALPSSAFAHERILGWVTGIQSELDHGWAVLGEVFGRHARLQNLRIRLRRLATPLTNFNFARSHNRPYRPPLGRFTVDADALLRLMIKPLYGAKPEIAVRELLQNSVDAVRIADLYRKSVNGSNVTQYPILGQLQVDIVVSLCKRDSSFEEDVPSEWQYWLEVADSGIGMTEDVIRNYFLRIGASLRNSPWYSQFSEHEQTELYRIGRFGIGVLAGFLCSDCLHVTTRHISSEEGFEFNCNLSNEGVEISPSATSPEGTRVRMQLTQETYDYLKSNRRSAGIGAENPRLDWYALSMPRVAVIYRCGADISVITPRYRIPSAVIPSQWRTISADGDVTIQWSFEKKHPHCDVYVNGMLVEDIHYQTFRSTFGSQLKAPVISILDPANVTGLTVTRDRLSGGIPFKEELVRDILLDHIAWLFVQASISPAHMSPIEAPGWHDYSYEAGGGDADSERGPYLLCRQGLIPMSQSNIARADIRRLACINSVLKNDDMFQKVLSFRPSETPILFNRFSIYGGFAEPRESVTQRYLLDPIRTPAFAANRWTALIHQSNRRLLGSHIYNGTITSETEEFLCVEGGGGGIRDPELERLFTDSYRGNGQDVGPVEKTRPLNALILMEVQLGTWKDTVDKALNALWSELGLPAIIPFEQAQRRNLIRTSGGKLVPYIERHYRSMTASEQIALDRWWD